MTPVVSDQASEYPTECRVGVSGARRPIRGQGHMRVLPSTPRLGRCIANLWVGIGQEPGIGRSQFTRALGKRHLFDETLPFQGKDSSHVASDPLGLAARAGG
jgi:hypothetical protein